MPPILANVGVPMIFPQMALMGVGFLPVVLIEAAIVRRPMAIRYPKALVDVGLANLCTTVLGVPFAWGVMFALDLVSTGGRGLGAETPVQKLAAVTLQAAWLAPYEEQLSCMIPAAATVLLIPCFVVSLLIERWVLVRRWPERDRSAVFSAVLRANVCSYLFLFIAGSLWAAIEFH
jgi:hypothetical protein